MILRSVRTFWYKGSAVNKETRPVQKRILSPKDNSPGLEAYFSQHVGKSIKLTIYKCVVNVIPVTNPTQYIKLYK